MRMVLKNFTLYIKEGNIARASDLLPLIRKCMPMLLLLETGVDAVGKFTLESRMIQASDTTRM